MRENLSDLPARVIMISWNIINSTMNDVKIEVHCDPSEEETDLIFNGLVEFNESRVGDARFKEFGILASGESEATIAGLLGHTLWNGFFISALWVAEAVRRKGIGQQLLARAEKLAIQNGCDHIHLDTFDFQARDFYEKNGFQIFGAIEALPYWAQEILASKKAGSSDPAWRQEPSAKRDDQ
jgi:GNAT superfamily N-acetyltransferase